MRQNKINLRYFNKKAVFVFCILATLKVYSSNTLIKGCTDPLSTNYNPNATVNDGSCSYATVFVTPTSSIVLSSTISETSGLIYWDNYLWTHNDNTDTKLYGIDPNTGGIVKNYTLSGVVNTDWEDISQDENYIYIGDFGNNGNGNRTNLKILRISKSSLLKNLPVVENINFSYSNQTSFVKTGVNKTDFDCEGFIVSTDSIFLFTKQWVSENTSVYSLSKNPGTHKANFKAKYDVKGLITGATYLKEMKLVALSGYSTSLAPFIYLLYDFSGNDFFSANKRKIEIANSFFQLEGITTTNGLAYYISNEHFTYSTVVDVQQSISSIDLTSFLGGYFNALTAIRALPLSNKIKIYPNPANNQFSITAETELPTNISIIDISGATVMEVNDATIANQIIRIDNLNIPEGLYVIKIRTKSKVYSHKLTIVKT